MVYLIDTSVLVRLASVYDPLNPVAEWAVTELHGRSETLRLTPQALVEFRSVATRPRTVNGLGLSPTEAETKATDFETLMGVVDETPAIFPAWKRLVSTASVIGKQVHDARLAAICQVNGISHLLTFNIGHMTRLASFVPGLTIVHPASV